MEYDNRGKVSLWKSDKGGSGPILSGKVVAHRNIKKARQSTLLCGNVKVQRVISLS